MCEESSEDFWIYISEINFALPFSKILAILAKIFLNISAFVNFLLMDQSKKVSFVKSKLIIEEVIRDRRLLVKWSDQSQLKDHKNCKTWKSRQTENDVFIVS